MSNNINSSENNYYKQVEDAMKPVQDALRPVLVVGTSRDAPTQKQGHKSYGGCCDTRRAVIIVNSINLFLIIINFLSLYIFSGSYNNNPYANRNVIHTMQLVRIIVCIIGILGSMYYKVYMIGLAAMMYILDALMNLIGFNIIHLIISALFAYPHFFLMQEIKDNIMTVENYPNEEHSCCCV